MAVNPAERKRKLSKNLLLMKFMQRGAIKNEQTVQDENEQVIDDEHWVRHNPLPQQTVLVRSPFIVEPSYSICENLSFGRRSYKGFNPEVEKICKAMDTVQEVIESEKREQENSVTDEDMAARYSSLSNTIRKKFMSKHDRSRGNEDDTEMPQDDNDNDSASSAKKLKRTKKKFLKPVDS